MFLFTLHFKVLCQHCIYILTTSIRLELNPYIIILQVKWIRMLYSDFSIFYKDQEHLISSENSFDYVEGFVIINRTGLLNNWRSSFSPKDPLQASQFHSEGKTLYCLEIAKYFNTEESGMTNQVS